VTEPGVCAPLTPPSRFPTKKDRRDLGNLAKDAKKSSGAE
jgi:hypothetical protein